MKADTNRSIRLEISASPPLLRIVTQFVESAASAFGLGKDECLQLSLAAEEIFLYLSKFTCPEQSMEVICFNGFYYTRVTFHFSAAQMNLSGLNIASKIDPDRETDLETMGLMIASRSVDHLNLTLEKNNRIGLSIRKNRSYPADDERYPQPQSAQKILTEIPDAERLKHFAGMTGQYYALSSRPSFFTYPGKVADMVSSGEYKALVAINHKREIIGGMLFCFRTEKIVQCFGPYSFDQEQEKTICEILIEACISSIARSRALGLLSLSGLPSSLRNHFEILGSLRYYTEKTLPVNEYSYYRHLHEDPGLDVWTCSDITDFLGSEYQRLALARNLRIVRNMGEIRSGASLLSAEINRDRLQATLRPLLPGDDFQHNIEKHILFLRGDHLLNIYFELDLGISWHAELIPVLLANQFRPAIILPFAGQSDTLILQHYDETKP